MPPWVRDRWVHSRVSRGSWYSSWASSTWRRPSWVCACSAKMSRMSRLRSMTLTPSSPSRVRCWAGDSSSSAMSTSKPVSRLADSSSSALPLPTYQFGSTWRRFCHSAPTTSAPAVDARLASSARDSWAVQPSSAPVSTATRKAFSMGGLEVDQGHVSWPTSRIARSPRQPVRRRSASDASASSAACSRSAVVASSQAMSGSARNHVALALGEGHVPAGIQLDRPLERRARRPPPPTPRR